MVDEERRLIRETVAAWQRAGPVLDRERRERIRGTDTVRGLAAFAGLTWAALEATGGATPGSGLVEQQRWFGRIARRGPG